MSSSALARKSNPGEVQELELGRTGQAEEQERRKKGRRRVFKSYGTGPGTRFRCELANQTQSKLGIVHPALVRYQMQSDALLLVRCRKRVWSVPAPGRAWPQRTGPDTEHAIFRIGPEIQPRRSPRVGVGKNRTSGRARKAEEGEEAGIQKLRYRTGNAVPLRAGQTNPIKARNRSPSASPVPDAFARTSFGPMPKTRLVGAGAGPGVAGTDRTRHGACHLPHWPGNPKSVRTAAGPQPWEGPMKKI